MEQVKTFFSNRTKLELVGMIATIMFILTTVFSTKPTDYSKRMKDLVTINQSLVDQVMRMEQSMIDNNTNMYKRLLEKDEILVKKFIIIENLIDSKKLSIKDLEGMKIFD